MDMPLMLVDIEVLISGFDVRRALVGLALNRV